MIPHAGLSALMHQFATSFLSLYNPSSFGGILPLLVYTEKPHHPPIPPHIRRRRR